MEVNGTKPAGMTSSEAHPSHLVLYQVCVDRDGDDPFEGTGVQHADKAQAMAHLKETQKKKPYAYLASVTYQRCIEHGKKEFNPLSPHETQAVADNLESIASFARLGLRSTETLQAVASLFGRLRPSEEHDPGQIADDLVIAVEGMVEQLQTLHELFDNIEIKSGYYEGASSLATTTRSDAHEPAMV